MNKEDKKKLIELWDFLDADMPSKIFSEEYLNNQCWTRNDNFEDKKQVTKYLRTHFLLAFPELNLQNKPKTQPKGYRKCKKAIKKLKRYNF